jgi:hypothetical protein
MTPYAILETLAKFITRSEVAEIVKADVTKVHVCAKCAGKGIIPGFEWYANGVCFDCYGTGKTGSLNVALVPKGRALYNTFYVSRNYSQFPEGVENICEVQHIGHPTAAHYLAKKAETYYIHQPICGGNGWFEFPADQYEEFRALHEKYAGILLPIKTN